MYIIVEKSLHRSTSKRSCTNLKRESMHIHQILHQVVVVVPSPSSPLQYHENVWTQQRQEGEEKNVDMDVEGEDKEDVEMDMSSCVWGNRWQGGIL
jgi:hypothetical protein